MARLAAMWPGRSPDQTTAAVYAEALGHLDDTLWEAAIGLCLRECTFHPVPGEILARVEWLLTEAGMLPETPDDAWARVLQVALSSRPGEVETLPDLAYETVEDLGGIHAMKIAFALGQIERSRRQFLSLYGARRLRLIRRPETLAQALPSGVGQLASTTR